MMGEVRIDELESLYRREYRRFVRVAAAILRDEAGAVDAVQDAFASAIRRRRQFRGEGPLEAWVWRMVVNAALKERRRPAHPGLNGLELEAPTEQSTRVAEFDRAVTGTAARGALPSLLRRPGLRLDRDRIADLAGNGRGDPQCRTRLASTLAAGGTTMNEFSSHVFDQLDAYTPEPRALPEWDDVVARAHKARVRGLVVVFAAALTLFGSAAAVTAALGGFDRWLSGEPGKPASSAEQKIFETANGRSWAAFPTDTELRELIRTVVDGKTYVLFGFRSGNTLCLKLKAVSLGHSAGASCTPVATVAHATAPIVVVNRDWGFQDRHGHESAQVSFGIVADGVRRVDVSATDGSHRATVGGNAYLFAENDPNTGNRVLAVSALSPDARRSTISFRTTYGLGWESEVARSPRGPNHVEASIPHPRIGWYARGEHRGRSGDQLKSTLGISPTGSYVKPDPLSDVVVGLYGNLCLALIADGSAGEGCNSRESFFALGPLNVMISGGGGTQAMVVAGAAADGVSRVIAFGSDGQQLLVPLRNNLFAARVALPRFPIRLVGYDKRGRIVAIRTLRSGPSGSVLPASAWTPLGPRIHVRGPGGATAILRVTRGTDNVRCWIAVFSTGESRRGCKPTYPTGPWVYADLVQPAGRDLFVVGNVRPPVKILKLRFEDGTTTTRRPTADLFLFAIPRRYLRTERQLAFVRGYDAHGQVIQRAPVLFKVRAS
jgi:Sigma-70 region 2